MRLRVLYTDYGTVVLHWIFALIVVVMILTGLRISVGATEQAWLLALDGLLPKTFVWTIHIPLAFVMTGVVIAYAYYVAAARLFNRIRVDRTRLSGLAKAGQPRRSAVNVLLYWLLFLTIALQILSGFALYLGYGGIFTDIHRIATWIVIVYIAGHVVAQFSLGGISQILRIVRPGPIAPPPPPFNPYEMLLQHIEAGTSGTAREAPPADEPEPVKQGWHRRALANPLVMALLLGALATFALYFTERVGNETLHISSIAPALRPVLDGDLSDVVWRSARPVVVHTNQGANFDGKGETTIEIRAVHDGEWAYFAFVWTDQTRSLKHLPLVKTQDGWRILQTKYDASDETDYFEDKFSVLLTKADVVIPGDRTFHSGRRPLEGRPASGSGRGLHFTTDGSIVDVWQWRATSNGEHGCADNGHFGPPAVPDAEQAQGRKPYKGGYGLDEAKASYQDNFTRPKTGYGAAVHPARLPKDWKASVGGLGLFHLDPDHGDAEGARWFLTSANSWPYSAVADAAIPVGTVIPGVVRQEECAGDRARIFTSARWAAGRWTLEVARRLDTGSPNDVTITTDTFMRVAAFDHSQSHHTRTIRPVRLGVEKCPKCAECPSTEKSSMLSLAKCYLTQLF